jgi:sulfite exporter TauE/SafE
LISSAFLMGLAGGPHCVAMCGAACAGFSQTPKQPYAIYQYHFGRLSGYAMLGAIAAIAMQSIAWLSAYSKILHPIWTFFHILVFFWGVMLMIFARQPLWVERAGGHIWQKVKKLARIQCGFIFIGLLWALMPCGLLYSALIIASFNGNVFGGAISMAAFAIGSSVSLFFAPWLWLKIKTNAIEPYGMRLAGLLLSLASAWAIWMDLIHQTKIWCL